MGDPLRFSHTILLAFWPWSLSAAVWLGADPPRSVSSQRPANTPLSEFYKPVPGREGDQISVSSQERLELERLESVVPPSPLPHETPLHQQGLCLISDQQNIIFPALFLNWNSPSCISPTPFFPGCSSLHFSLKHPFPLALTTPAPLQAKISLL